MLIDSHCHLHDRQFFSAEEAQSALNFASYNGVKKIVVIGTDHKDSLAARDFASAHPNVYWTYGIHPNEWRTWDPLKQNTPHENAPGVQSTPRKTLEQKTNSVSKLVAIGEVGLDYHYGEQDRQAQIKLLNAMLALATTHHLPLSFHVREAFDDFFGVIANFPHLHAVIHSFSDNKKNLNRILTETNFYVGVNGMATYSTLPLPPLERILLETDAPFLSPHPHRTTKNQPAYIKDIANWLATKTATPLEQIAKITTQNATALFHLD